MRPQRGCGNETQSPHAQRRSRPITRSCSSAGEGERSRVGAGELGREARAEPGRRHDDVAAKIAVGRRVHDGAVGGDARGVDPARAEEAHAERGRASARAASETRGRKRASGRSSMSSSVTSCAPASVAAVSVPISPAPTTTTRLRGTASRCTSETRPAAVVFSSACSKPGIGRLRVAQARRPDERRRLELERRASGRAADDEPTAVEVAARHDAVDVLDASLGELRRVCEERHATGHERALGERRPIVRQARADHRHGHAVLGETGRARISGDAVADDDDRVAHAPIRAPRASQRIGGHPIGLGKPACRSRAVTDGARTRGPAIIDHGSAGRRRRHRRSTTERKPAWPRPHDGQLKTSTPSRRQLFALAAVLAATALTGAAAIAGLHAARARGARRRRRSARPSPPPRRPRRARSSRETEMRNVWATVFATWALFAVLARARLDAAAAARRRRPAIPTAVVVKGKNGQSHLVVVQGGASASHATTRTSPVPGRMIAAAAAGVPVAWLVARAAGLVAFALLTVSVTLGLALSTRLLGTRRGKMLLGWHQTLMWTGLAMVVPARRRARARPGHALRIRRRARARRGAVAAPARRRRHRHRVADARRSQRPSTSVAGSASAAGACCTTPASAAFAIGLYHALNVGTDLTGTRGLIFAGIVAAPVVWLVYARILMPRPQPRQAAGPPRAARLRRPRAGRAKAAARRCAYDPRLQRESFRAMGTICAVAATAEPNDVGSAPPRARRRAGARWRPASVPSRASTRAATSRGSTAPPAPGSPSTRGSSTRSPPRCAARTETRRTVRPDDPSGARRRRLRPLLRAARRAAAGSARRLACRRAHRRSTADSGRARVERGAAVDLGGIGKGFAATRALDAMRDSLARADRERSSISAATSPSGAPLPRAGRGAWTSPTREHPTASPERSSSTRGGVATSGTRHAALRARRTAPPPHRPCDRRARRRRPALGHRRGTERDRGRGARNRARGHRPRRGARPARARDPTSRRCSSPSSASRSSIGRLPLAPRAPDGSVRRHHAGRTVPMALKARTHAVVGGAARRSPPLRVVAAVVTGCGSSGSGSGSGDGAIGRRLHPPGHDAVLARPVRAGSGTRSIPPTRPIVSRARYMACQSNAGFDLQKFKVLETYADTVDVAGKIDAFDRGLRPGHRRRRHRRPRPCTPSSSTARGAGSSRRPTTPPTSRASVRPPSIPRRQWPPLARSA